MNNPEQTHHITALLMTHAKGIKKTKIDDLKMMVVQASKTFEHNEMMAFSRVYHVLSRSRLRSVSGFSTKNNCLLLESHQKITNYIKTPHFWGVF